MGLRSHGKHPAEHGQPPPHLPTTQVAEGEQQRWVQVTSTHLKLPAQQEVKREINFNCAAPARTQGEIKVTGQGPWGGDNLPPGPVTAAGRRGPEWVAEGGRHRGSRVPRPHPDLSLSLSSCHQITECQAPSTPASPGPRTVPSTEIIFSEYFKQ